MVLGGRSIEEWKEVMSFDEYMRWKEYRKLRGPMNPMLRNDYAFAMLCVFIKGLFGKKAELEDYLLWKPEEEATLEDIAKIVGARINGREP